MNIVALYFPSTKWNTCTAATSTKRDKDNIPMENILSVKYLICGVTFSALFPFWSLGLQVPEEQWRRAHSGKQIVFPIWEGWKGLGFGGCRELLLFTGEEDFFLVITLLSIVAGLLCSTVISQRPEGLWTNMR